MHGGLPLRSVFAGECFGVGAGLIHHLHTEGEAGCLAWWRWGSEGRGSSILDTRNHMVAQLPHRSRQFRAGLTCRRGNGVVVVVVVVVAAVIRARLGVEFGSGRRWGKSIGVAARSPHSGDEGVAAGGFIPGDAAR